MDDGYEAGDPEFCKTHSSIYHPEGGQAIRNVVRARHETANKCLKQEFGALSSVFWHDLSKHSTVVRSSVVFTQLAINRGEKLFDVENYDENNNNEDEEEGNE